MLLDSAEVAKHEREDAQANRISLAEHEMRGIALLFEHYEIRPRDHEPDVAMALLAMELARNHVPFFQEKQAKRGPKDRPHRAALLEVDIALRRLAGDKSDAQAVRHLVRNVEPWKLRGRARDADPAGDLLRRRREWSAEPVAMFVQALVNEHQEKKAEKSLQTLRRIFSESNSALR